MGGISLSVIRFKLLNRSTEMLGVGLSSQNLVGADKNIKIIKVEIMKSFPTIRKDYKN